MNREWTIEPARAGDLDGMLTLLARSHLPLDGLAACLPTTIVARLDGEIVGVAALEPYADGGLLRSVAVDAPARHLGIGRALVDTALTMADARGIGDLFLLTTTAEEYFPRFGFESIAREQVPASVRASVEFTSACPTSATVMRRLARHDDGSRP